MFKKLSLISLMVATLALSGCTNPFAASDNSKPDTVTTQPKPIQKAGADENQASISGDYETVGKSFSVAFHSVNYVNLQSEKQKTFNGLEYVTPKFADNLSRSFNNFKVGTVGSRSIITVLDAKLMDKTVSDTTATLKFLLTINVVNPDDSTKSSQHQFVSTLTMIKIDGKWLVDMEKKQ